jgi:acyl-CoA thioester hydrolase
MQSGGKTLTEGLAFECRFEVRWADIDGNRHVRNTAFSEYATHARFQLLATKGFDQATLEEMRFGPVMMREEIRYRREVRFGDSLVVTVRSAGMSPDVFHWRVHQDILREDGKEAAVLKIQGGWIDLDHRSLVVPPVGLAGVLLGLRRTRDYAELPSLIRRRG